MIDSEILVYISRISHPRVIVISILSEVHGTTDEKWQDRLQALSYFCFDLLFTAYATNFTNDESSSFSKLS